MDIILAALFLLPLVAVVAWLAWRKQSRPRNARASRPSRYAAVSLIPGAGACSHARALAGQRILLRDAPALPVSECANKRCKCELARHADRRRGEADRRMGYGMQTELFSSLQGREERRHRRGRRADDLAPA